MHTPHFTLSDIYRDEDLLLSEMDVPLNGFVDPYNTSYTLSGFSQPDSSHNQPPAEIGADSLLPLLSAARLGPMLLGEIPTSSSTKELLGLDRQLLRDVASRNPLRSARRYMSSGSLEAAVDQRLRPATSVGPLAGLLLLDKAQELDDARRRGDSVAYDEAQGELLGGLALLGGVDVLGGIDDASAQLRAAPARIGYQGLKGVPQSAKAAFQGLVRRPLTALGALGLGYRLTEGFEP
jgi:hypothetical protein